MRSRIVIGTCALLLCACAHQPPKAPPQPVVAAPPEPAHYEEFPGRGPAIVAALRAGPAPEQPELVTGTTIAADRQMQIARGFVQIGSARFRADDPAAARHALDQGKDVGADRMIVYEHRSAGDSGSVAADASNDEYLAVYYVLFKPPFGATFRDLKPDEQLILGAGVEIGSVIGGTPAAEANLLAGDFIVKLNGKSIQNRAHFERLLRAHAGRSVTLKIHRNGQFLDRLVRLGSAPTQ